ncbi:TetR family transcriptional regulator [Aquihabitans daechungensis]|uniref:TetR family transcriptional regulator n=1 Tax=Aquihabitans daechungensis TaxID=1052257 RepID=UPI003B9DCF61
MSDPVKRPYDSTRRQEQARRTRARIIEAATDRFVELGYGAASIAAVAEAAEVSPQTIYATFGTKAALLSAAVDVALAGDDEPVAVFDREGSQATLAAPTAAEAAAAFARATTAVLARAGRILAAADAAAQSDPELATMWVMGHTARHADMARTAAAFEAAGFLRPGLDAEAAADLLWAIASPDAFRSFTLIRGWSAERYERWLGDTVRDAVFTSAGRGGRP